MKGIIFNLLEEMIEGEGGASAWDDLLDRASVDGGYTSIGDYPDDELMSLVSARADMVGHSRPAVLRAFGRHSILRLAERFPDFFTPYRHTPDFLLTLNDVIHPEVRKLHAAARPPEFDFDVTGADTMSIGYQSERRLCFFAEGMIQGAGDYFGENVDLSQDSCVESGADLCVIRCTFESRPSELPAVG